MLRAPIMLVTALTVGAFSCSKPPAAHELPKQHSETKTVSTEAAPGPSLSKSKAGAAPTADAPVGAITPGELPETASRFPAPARLVALGDLHGDLRATKAALRLAGAIDEAEGDAPDSRRAVGDGQPELLPRGDRRGDLQFGDGGHGASTSSKSRCQVKNDNTSAPSATRIAAGLPTPCPARPCWSSRIGWSS